MRNHAYPLGLWLLVLLWLSLGPAGAQVRVTLSGTVQDASSGENLSFLERGLGGGVHGRRG